MHLRTLLLVRSYILLLLLSYFFLKDPATTEIYTLSLHDALPICGWGRDRVRAQEDVLPRECAGARRRRASAATVADRKSTRLNSSHLGISYAVFCLKKKKETKKCKESED